ncbi:fumarylacetoacetate hydrolase family protein [Phenylobacterium sp.]|uniref:fumarylacetoacetate hydrolase family protein n=1 Tax=Phenylobacterium sp. TaxID=1871053 RepID=UPI002FE0A94B
MPSLLPHDAEDSLLIGRIRTREGPSPVAVRQGRLEDLSAVAPTVADLLARLAPNEAVPAGRDLGPLADHDLAPEWTDGDERPLRLLAPIDLQAVKACGVTFAVSAIERVIEERARGDAGRADAIRGELQARIGADIGSVRPGSEAAARLKDVLIGEGLWSQYLEVAIGPHAEVFTKAQPLSAVGTGAYVGVRSDSEWNNPEPEVVLVCDPQGRARGAMLGNDVNLRDFEGRSALLLGEAKDNNASCAVGPFIRLFDGDFTMDDVRQAVVSLEIQGEDNFRLEGTSTMSLISRDPLDLAAQATHHHQYPDGFVLFLGTLFAPTQDRDAPGRGFTHKTGDVVRVASPKLGLLENKVTSCELAPPWTFGVGALMRNLAGRGLLSAEAAR